MRMGGRLLAEIREELAGSVIPGAKPIELDARADRLIRKSGGKPSFKMVPGYHWASCITINEGVVHGIPTSKPLLEGDLVSIDIGMWYRGLHTDTATTVIAGAPTREKEAFLAVGRQALRRAIDQAVVSHRVGHISRAIQMTVEEKGYACITTLTGHGVGSRLHEDPPIPCVLNGKVKDTPLLKDGQGLAIEVIYTQGSPEMVLGDDGWTLSTKDGSLAALFEETIVVTEAEPLIVTVTAAERKIHNPRESGRFVIQ